MIRVKNHQIPPTILVEAALKWLKCSPILSLYTNLCSYLLLSHLHVCLIFHYLGLRSDPCCMRVPTVNQKLLARVKSFCTTYPVSTQGCGADHSFGENLCNNP